MSIYCPKCDSANSEDTILCSLCGHQIGQVASAIKGIDQKPKKNRRSETIVIFAGIVIVAMIAVYNAEPILDAWDNNWGSRSMIDQQAKSDLEFVIRFVFLLGIMLLGGFLISRGTVMKFQNPTNGYIEEASMPFLCTLLFGCLYFAIKGIWTHFVVSLVLAICTCGLSWLIYPFFVKEILRTHYKRQGWKEIDAFDRAY